jgi:Putative Actinobacterial Holin-X, holin superfamily III
MAHESPRDSGLVRAATDLFADLSDLIQKEIRLARAEIVHKLTLGVRGGVWMAVAGVLGFLAVIFVLEGAVFAIASTGIALYGACFIVAAALLLIAAGAFISGRSQAEAEFAPRTARQLGVTLRTAKEQLR